MAMANRKLHGTGIGGDLFHLTEIYHKGTMATDYHGIGLQRVFHLFHRGTEHRGMNIIVMQLAHLNVIADSF